jgi:hypothetical protein
MVFNDIILSLEVVFSPAVAVVDLASWVIINEEYMSI